MENPEQPGETLYCLRCQNELAFMGTKKFLEGSRGWGFVLGDLGELFVNREHMDVYWCPSCGKVELFVEGVGEEDRE